MISAESATNAVAAMQELIAFFPKEERALTLITLTLQRMVDTEEHLNWLIETAVNSIHKWESLAQLRGLYCTRFKPLDGITVPCDVPGFTDGDRAAAAEQAFFERESAETQKKIAEWKREQKLLVGDVAPGIAIVPVAKIVPPAIRIPSTPVRTPEERAKLEAELSEQVRQYQLQTEKGTTK